MSTVGIECVKPERFRAWLLRDVYRKEFERIVLTACEPQILTALLTVVMLNPGRWTYGAVRATAIILKESMPLSLGKLSEQLDHYQQLVDRTSDETNPKRLIVE